MAVNTKHVADVLDKVNSPLKPLEPLEPVPISHGAVAIKIDPNAKYIVFINAKEIDLNDFITNPNIPLPDGTPVYAIYNDINNAVRIFELLDTKGKNGR